jgi:hypothetical protein
MHLSFTKKRPARLAAILAAATLGTAAFSAPAAAWAAEPTASISGTVRSAVTVPVPNAVVTFDLVGTSSAIEQTVAAAPDGSFSATGLAAGKYLVTFSTPDGSFAPVAWGDNNPVLVRPDPIDATAGGDITAIDATMTPALTIAGTLTGPKSLVAEGAQVVPFGWDPDAGKWAALTGPVDVTPELTFSIPGAAPGTYKFQVLAAGKPVYQEIQWTDVPLIPLSHEFVLLPGSSPIVNLAVTTETPAEG